MQVEVVPLTDFVHGRITAREGHPVMMDEHVAADLERNRLVRVRFMPRPVVAIVAKDKIEAGKAPDDGRGQPSSALDPAPASPTKTLQPSERGQRSVRKSDA